MTTAMHRETQRRKRGGTYSSPTPSATSSINRRRAPRAKTIASAAGSGWTDEESDELWDWHHQNPGVRYQVFADMKNGRRTDKAYREHMHILVKQRAGLPTRSNRPNTQQRRATLTATRERAAQRQETPQTDVPDVPPMPTTMPVAVPFVQDAHRTDSYAGAHDDQEMRGTSDDEDDVVQTPMVRRTRGSGQRSR